MGSIPTSTGAARTGSDSAFGIIGLARRARPLPRESPVSRADSRPGARGPATGARPGPGPPR
eukprot:633440-Hanusia_phi.AAC.1